MTDWNAEAKKKQTVLTGGDVSYYLTELSDGTVVENDDVNRVLQLSFAQGTSLKSLTRLCKKRMDLGKPNSTPEYEIGKVIYYNNETYLSSLAAEKDLSVLGKVIRFIRDPFLQLHRNIQDVIIDVPAPKRLQPYSFRIGDFIDAHAPTDLERTIMENLFEVALCRMVGGPVPRTELFKAAAGKEIAKLLKDQPKEIPENVTDGTVAKT